MIRPTPKLRGMAATILLLLFGASLSGCFNPFNPLVAKNQVGASDPPPNPTRPDLAIRLFQWCWQHRAIDQYEEIFTDDFLFAFAATDSAGNAFRDRALTRFDEIQTASHLFVGGGTNPPANSISLQLDQNLIPQQDSRPGKQDTTFFQEIVTSVVLQIKTDQDQFQVTGQARFFLARADSAIIPAELLARGFQHDKNRWYIQRWEDETIGTPGTSAIRARGGALGARPGPAVHPDAAESTPIDVTWGTVKRIYYSPDH
jgi:hypothetical protein